MILVVFSLFVWGMEWARIRFSAFNQLFLSLLGGLIREEERTKLSGVFWMVAGVLTIAILIKSPPLSIAILLYLLLGDTAAGLGGKWLKGPHWGQSPKRVSGSLSCFIVCFFIGFFLLRPGYNGTSIFIGALVATGAEYGMFRMNDNFLIPALSSLFFWLYDYGLGIGVRF